MNIPFNSDRVPTKPTIRKCAFIEHNEKDYLRSVKKEKEKKRYFSQSVFKVKGVKIMESYEDESQFFPGEREKKSSFSLIVVVILEHSRKTLL